MAKYTQNAAILTGKRTRTATVAFVAAPADKLKRESRGIVLPSSRFTKTWWQEHVATLTPAAPEVPDDQAIVTPAQPALNAKAKRAVRTRQEQALETATRIAALETACAKVQEEFQNSFTWEERKLIAANSYEKSECMVVLVEKATGWGMMLSCNLS